MLCHRAGIHAFAASPCEVVAEIGEKRLDSRIRQLHPAQIAADVAAALAACSLKKIGDESRRLWRSPDETFSLGNADHHTAASLHSFHQCLPPPRFRPHSYLRLSHLSKLTQTAS